MIGKKKGLSDLGVYLMVPGANNAKNKLVEKNFQVLIEYPLKNKESNKKMVRNS